MKRMWMAAVLAAAAVPAAMGAERIRVVNEGGIRDAWTLPPGAVLAGPRYPEAHAADPVEACVAIGYLLNPDGHTSDFALLKTWSAAEPAGDLDTYWASFAEAAAAALAQWRFQPRPETGPPTPVYTVGTFVFASAQPLETRKHCQLADLGGRLLELRRDRKSRRRMASVDVLGRLDLDPAMEQRYLDQQRNYGRQAPDPERRTPPPAPPPPPPPPPSPA